MTINWKSRWRLVALTIGASALISACAASVPVEAEFPTPLVEPLPIRVGVVFSEALRTYEYYEEIPQHSKWTIQLGRANVAMFGPLFTSMFQETRIVDTLPLSETDREDLDALVEPELEKFEFDVPRNTDSKFVEVWLQYRLRLLQTDGTQIAAWPVVGYGKAQTGMLGNEGSLRRAAVRAMREVGATVSTDFAKQPAVGEWLEENQHEANLSVDTKPRG